MTFEGKLIQRTVEEGQNMCCCVLAHGDDPISIEKDGYPQEIFRANNELTFFYYIYIYIIILLLFIENLNIFYGLDLPSSVYLFLT